MIQIFVVLSLHGIIQMLAISSFHREPTQVVHLFEVNPLTLRSDQLLISPHNVSLESNIEVTRSKEMITD